MKHLTDAFTLHNGVTIPCIGYGAYSPNNDISSSVLLNAIQAGYRHIDTAFFYHNEQEVGEAVKKCGVPREELFITSKVWNGDRGYESTKAAFELTMKNLDLDYLDLYLIHWPANRKQFGDEAPIINSETWRAMEELYNEGRIRAIGISNFLPHHIDDLMKTATITPMVNQIEFHPGWPQTYLASYCQKLGIVVEAWSPLARSAALNDETLVKIANAHNKTAAQVCLRWVLQHDILPLPKSVNPERMVANTDVFDFELTEEEMHEINLLQCMGGECFLPDEVYF